MNENNTLKSRVDVLRSALTEPADPMRGRGSKTRMLDLLEKEILALLDSGVTYAQVALRLSRKGFRVSGNTIAAWRKRKRREQKAAQVSQGIRETSKDGVGEPEDPVLPQAQKESENVGGDGKGINKRTLGRTRSALKNPYRHN